ncbi:hypothetical protein [Rhizorhabdus histidinilytica]|uniref:DUF3739 domain-containing protein n=1 Tax=Rhizorhabdus histidinilytica TaxID=439228 RepID=A0A1T5C248_9SPHN|nr:hypothetical protein [Rhizorhabdus histidinilytica]SKB53658.1 hypothetical protein SAMN06295920_103533 [Rhizorhabdus histidinilytica]
MTSTTFFARLSLGLLASASIAGLATPAMAGKLLFSDDPALAGATLAAGQEVRTSGGTTQIMTDNGSIVSLVGGGAVRVDGDDVTVLAGSVTVATRSGDSTTSVRLPGGATARLSGVSPSGSFTVTGDGFTGHALGGNVSIQADGQTRVYTRGSAWQGQAGSGTSRIFANRADPAPAASRTAGSDAIEPAGDTARAAAAGVPVNLGEALAAVGASGDVVQAARNVEASATNPAVPAFPADDVATLVDFAAQLQSAYGGQLFAGAEPGIIQTYLAYLANGGAGDQFKATYAALINQYIDLLRTGASPASFTGANQAAVNSYLAYLSSTGALQGLSAQNRALADAYLDFLSSGGAATDFTRSYLDVVNAYIDFIKGGGAPANFTGATQDVINAYFAFLQSSGLVDAIAQANRSVFDAYAQYLANGGTGVFVPPGGSNPGTGPGTGPVVLPDYAAALQAYITFLKGGGNPNGFSGITVDLIRQYINLAIDNGLFAGVPAPTIQLIRDALNLLATTGTFDAIAPLLANLTLVLPTIPTTPTGPTTPTTPVTGDGTTGQMIAYAGDVIGIDSRDKTTVTTGDGGKLLKYVWTTNPDGESPEIGTNNGFESGSVAGVIGWTRWAGGSTAGKYFGNPPVSRSDKQGLHLVYGAPATNLPTSGTATYALVGATKPTISDGSRDPGTLSGSAAVAFGTTPKVGLDLDVAIGGFVYQVNTSGGITDPAQSQISVQPDMSFFANSLNVAPGGPVCPASSCQADIRGFLAGPGASHLGISYSVNAPGGGPTVTGAAAFGK